MVHLKKRKKDNLNIRLNEKRRVLSISTTRGGAKPDFLRGGVSINFSILFQETNSQVVTKLQVVAELQVLPACGSPRGTPYPTAGKFPPSRKPSVNFGGGRCCQERKSFHEMEQMLTLRAHMLKLPLWYRVRCHFGNPQDFCAQKKGGGGWLGGWNGSSSLRIPEVHNCH